MTQAGGAGAKTHRLMVVGLAIVVLLVVAGVALYGYVRYRFAQVNKVAVPAAKHHSSGAPFNVLLVGSDSRSGLSAKQAAQYGSSQQAGGKRADTMILLRINPSTDRAAILSIPYDYFAPLAGGGGPNKISDALNGGPNELVATVEQDLGIPISHYAQVDFQGLTKMVNALGGIRLNFPYPSMDTMSGLSIPHPGCQTLYGTQALALARSRYFSYFKNGAWHYDGSGDFGRIHRQHAFVQAVVNRLANVATSEPLRFNSFVGVATQDLTLDKNLNLSSFLSLGEALKSASNHHVATFTVPTQIVNNYQSYGDVLFPVPSLDSAVISEFMSSVGSSPRSKTATPPATSGPVVSPTPPSNAGSIVKNAVAPKFNPVAC